MHIYACIKNMAHALRNWKSQQRLKLKFILLNFLTFHGEIYFKLKNYYFFIFLNAFRSFDLCSQSIFWVIFRNAGNFIFNFKNKTCLYIIFEIYLIPQRLFIVSRILESKCQRIFYICWIIKHSVHFTHLSFSLFFFGANTVQKKYLEGHFGKKESGFEKSYNIYFSNTK